MSSPKVTETRPLFLSTVLHSAAHSNLKNFFFLSVLKHTWYFLSDLPRQFRSMCISGLLSSVLSVLLIPVLSATAVAGFLPELLKGRGS